MSAKFICQWDNVACMVDNIPQDATLVVVVLSAGAIGVVLAYIWSYL